MESYRVINPPSTEPVTLSEAKAHLRVSNTLDDTLITSLIKAARQWVEGYTMRPLMTQIIEVNFDTIDSLEILINKAPIQSITSVSYINTSGQTVSISNSEYTLDLKSPVCRILLNEMPPIKKTLNAFTVTFQAGYTSANFVPNTYKQAILLLLTHFYVNRSEVESQNFNTIPMGVKTLLDLDTNRFFRT